MPSLLPQYRGENCRLHQQIMNLPCKLPPMVVDDQAYKLGHRDARHATAELVLSSAGSPLPEPDAHPCVRKLSGNRTLDVLRAAMVDAQIEHEDRANLIGHFCNRWNEAASPPPPVSDRVEEADGVEGRKP